MNKAFVHLGAALVCVALSACSGGDDDGTPVAADSNQIPASATLSTTALVDYSASLPPVDTTEPLDITTATPPTSETEEPLPIT